MEFFWEFFWEVFLEFFLEAYIITRYCIFGKRSAIKEMLFARLAQSVEREALNLVVVGSSPTVGMQQCGAEEACRAHNPEVRGSKPLTAKLRLTYSN